MDVGRTVAQRLLCGAFAGSLVITNGKHRNTLDIFLDTIGPILVQMGYSLQPFLTGGAVTALAIRKGKRKWSLAYFETVFGVPLSTGQEFAEDVGRSLGTPDQMARNIFLASDAVSEWQREKFGVATRHTVGMTALRIARQYLPTNIWKWRPPPLLVAMERIGLGYRAGMTYARTYKGRSWRIDVNRQYTHALTRPLPMKVAFGKYIDDERTPHGVFMCRLRLGNELPYPIGVWGGEGRGFEYVAAGRGSYVCVLHTAEFPGLLAIGADIEPSYGFIYTNTFSLAGYVERLQAIVLEKGRESAEAKLTKPLGNYIYGKLAQRPDRKELMYSQSRPGDSWHPYCDEEGNDWQWVWERDNVKHTASQHVDIAATITAYARGQTASTWALLSAHGLEVLRCHTDSLTVDGDPSGILQLNGDVFGLWKLENHDADTIIIGPNMYLDVDGPHIAGVAQPTAEMIELAYDSDAVKISMTQNAPRNGWSRGTREITREYRKAR